jgi:hypothetical protein
MPPTTISRPKRQQQRQVRHRVRQAFEESQGRQRQREIQWRRIGHLEPGRTQTRQTQAVVQRRADDEGQQHAGHPHGQFAFGHQHVEQQAEGDEAHHWRAQRFDQRQKAEQRQRRATDRTEQCRARHRAGDGIAEERQHQLQRAHHDQRRHAELPGRDGRGLLVHALLLEGNERRPQHQQRHADAGRRVQAKRHRRDVIATAAGREAARHPRVDQVAYQHAEGGAGEHARVHHVGRKTEDPDQRRGDETEDRQVVDDQTEETVEVAGDEPAPRGSRSHLVALHCRMHGVDGIAVPGVAVRQTIQKESSHRNKFVAMSGCRSWHRPAAAMPAWKITAN